MGSGFYGEDLAHMHGEGFGQLAAAAAGVVMQHIRERWQNPMVLDVGCGAGALSNALVQAGCRTWGIDISEAFVRMARAWLPQAELKLGSFFDVELPRAHAICAIGEVINYLADNNNSLDTLRRFFERAHTALEPGASCCSMPRLRVEAQAEREVSSRGKTGLLAPMLRCYLASACCAGLRLFARLLADGAEAMRNTICGSGHKSLLRAYCRPSALKWRAVKPMEYFAVYADGSGTCSRKLNTRTRRRTPRRILLEIACPNT